MVLVYKNGSPVGQGDEVMIRDVRYVVEGVEEPRTEASTGRVYVREVASGSHVEQYYPSVIDAKWV